MRLFGRKKEQQEPGPDLTSDEGIVGVYFTTLGRSEDAFSEFVAEHLRRIHRPGGYEQEKRESDFMDLGMRRAYIDALDDIELEVDDAVALPQTGMRKRGMANVLLRWTVRGVHNRPLLGIPPTGEQITITGVTFSTLRNYTIKASYTYWDFPELTRRMVER